MKQKYGQDFGRTAKKQVEIFDLSKEYKIRYSLIEPNLKYGFEYESDCYNAIIIKKKINIKNFKEDEFDRDLKYITDLYKEYEVNFENAIISLPENNDITEISSKDEISYEQINEKMLALIEEVGNLAKEIRELRMQKKSQKQD